MQRTCYDKEMVAVFRENVLNDIDILDKKINIIDLELVDDTRVYNDVKNNVDKLNIKKISFVVSSYSSAMMLSLAKISHKNIKENNNKINKQK